ncbi:VIT1/CCC1 transporter family protein [Brevundimonas mediterranea]|jgi:vacuolar iron transporter family protein|uniref:VIT1/CCC1 transporter family protein n=1 Tax=Brevundimonas mediterranea TaxID=74329 RepID=UPI00121577A6|nr:MAG: VIT family protein [Brevundimonas sp.]
MHSEGHNRDRVGWLRAAVLGANDGILSTGSLLVGVVAAGSSSGSIVLTGVAALAAGAMSMAAGEYVSVSSQSDAEQADLRKEADELMTDPESELAELTQLYVQRGLSAGLALQVARELTVRDALAAHARDELGLQDMTAARPVQAAVTSGFAFSVGALVPLSVAVFAPAPWAGVTITACSIACLAGLGAVGARLGGAPVGPAAIRVAFWGAAAMAATALIGRAFGTGQIA